MIRFVSFMQKSLQKLTEEGILAAQDNMDVLVKGLIDFQKNFQQEFLRKLEVQNKLIEKQNTVLEKLLNKMDQQTSHHQETVSEFIRMDPDQSEFEEEDTEYIIDHNEGVEESEIVDDSMQELETEIPISSHSTKYIRRKTELIDEEDILKNEYNPGTVSFPIDDINVLLEIEEEANVSEEFAQYLEKVFNEFLPQDELRFTNCGLNKLLSDEVITMMNWNGEQAKIKMSSMKIFKEILRNSWSSLYPDEADYLRIMKKHLKAAKRRLHTHNFRRRSTLVKKRAENESPLAGKRANKIEVRKIKPITISY